MNITDAFIEYIFELSESELTQQIKHTAKSCFLDYLGCAYVGASMFNGTFEMFVTQGGNASVIGTDHKTNPPVAAFINGLHVHSTELDDGHRFGMLHLGSVIVSAVFAICESQELSMDSMLKGIVIGYEAAVRLALSIQPGHKKRGFHTTGTCGTIGAAVGCSIAMGLDKVQMKTVVSVAATSAAGILEIQEDASELKAYNVAHAAQSGSMAALVGSTGLQCPDNILLGDRGWLKMFSDTINENKLVERASYYEIERIYRKPYAACRHCHSSIEAVLKIAERNNRTAEQISSIEVYTYKLAIKGHDHREVKGVSSAKLSMPFSVAAAYVLHSCFLDTYSQENIMNPDIIALAHKVKVIENEDFSKLSPEKRIAEVRINFKDETEEIERVDYAKGDPENPMTDMEIRSKFKAMMEYCGFANKAQEILRLFEEPNINIKQIISKV